jgi:hypothetical protein
MARKWRNVNMKAAAMKMKWRGARRMQYSSKKWRHQWRNGINVVMWRRNTMAAA